MSASITKHVNEPVNGEKQTTKTTKTSDSFDWKKREAINQQRKLRLNQVREQSKQIAANVREKVRDEKIRQLDIVNKVKKDELIKWKQKNFAQTNKDYKATLLKVGEAHRAAQHETQKMKQIESQKLKNRKIALQRGIVAAEKRKTQNTPAKSTNLQEKRVATVATQIDHSLNDDTDSSDSSMSSGSSVCSVIVVKTKKISPSKKKISPKKIKATPVKLKAKINEQMYTPEQFMSTCASTVTDISMDISSDSTTPRITKISEILKKPSKLSMQEEHSTIFTQPYTTKTYKVDTSAHEPRKSTPKQQKSKTLQKISKTKPTRPGGILVNPIKKKSLASKKTSAKNMNIHPYIPRFLPESNRPNTPEAPKVKFYDRLCMQEKEYDQKISIIETTSDKVPLSAMEEAAIERIRDDNYLREAAEMRRMMRLQSDIGYEKSTVRRDYEITDVRVTDLLKNRELVESFLYKNDVLSQKRLKEVAEERKNLSNEKLSNFTKDKSTSKSSLRKSASVDFKDASAQDCNSFLLDYVASRTSSIADDIGKCRQESQKNDDQRNKNKIDALTILSQRVDNLQKILTSEIERNETNGNRNIDFILDAMAQVENKQKIIMKDTENETNQKLKLDENKENEELKKKQSLKERERILKQKETILEQKIKELYQREKQLTQQKKIVTVQKNNVNEINSSSTDDIPVRITINVNKEKEKGQPIDKQKNEQIPNDKKWCEILEKPIKKKSNEPKRTSEIISKPLQKTKPIESSSQSTVTAYLSPPEIIPTKLTKMLREKLSISQPVKENSVNPQLLHYITRLLGMTRKSINQLNINSISTVSTPSSSIINISQNQINSISSNSLPDLNAFDEAKLDQLNKFIAGNHSFVVDLNDTIDRATKNDKENQVTQEERVWSEILKRNSKKTRTISKKSQKNDLITKYDDLTANCTKRIIDLDSMISKVREERQKLMENTLSSAGSIVHGQKENVTEYLDFPVPQGQSDTKSDDGTIASLNKSNNNSELKNLNTPSPELTSSSSAAIELLANKSRNLSTSKNYQLGESKDSGVGISRPVTSSDYRDSPELKQQTAPNRNEDSTNENYDFTRNISNSKLSSRIGEIIEAELQRNQNIQNDSNTSSKEKNFKPPPTALNRFSPRVDDERVHELSTITEVDTPVTSRLNATDMMNGADQTTILNKSQNGMNESQCKALLQMLYNRFPEFHEYVRSTSNIAQASETTTTSDKLENILSGEGNMSAFNYQSFHPAEQPELVNISNFNYKRFPPHSEYAKNSTNLLDSQSIDQMQMSENDDGHNTNSSSLPDIVSELRSRNLKHSFDMEQDNHECENKIVNNVQNNTASTIEKQGSGSISDTLEKELQAMGINWASSMIRKSKQAEQLSVSTSNGSSASETSSHATQRSTKKAQSPQKPPCTSKSLRKSSRPSESFLDIDLTSNSNSAQATGTSEKCDGKPVNLKDFLARELMKHSSASSSSDSSLASIFLKSFLGNSSSHQSALNPTTPIVRANDKHRTSTPVNVELNSGTRSISLKKPSPELDYHSFGFSPDDTQFNGNDLTNKLFSGESHLSSVHVHSSESDEIDLHIRKPKSEQEKHKEFEQNILPAAMRLNLAGPSSSSTTT